MPQREFIVQLLVPTGEPTDADLSRLRKIRKSLDRAAFRAAGGGVVSCSVAPGQMNIVLSFSSWGPGRSFIESYLPQQSWSGNATVAEVVAKTEFRVIWPSESPVDFVLAPDRVDPPTRLEQRSSPIQQSAKHRRVSKNPKKRRRAELDLAELRGDAAKMLRNPGVVTVDRLRPCVPRPLFLRDLDIRPDVGCISIVPSSVYVADPFALANIATSKSASAEYIRLRGVVTDFLRAPLAVPVLWSQERLVLPTSAHLDHPDIVLGKGVEILADRVVTLSGSFLILPSSDDLPMFLKRKLDEALTEGLAVSVGISPADYELCYEVYESPRHEFSRNTREFYNVVLQPLREAA